MDNNEDLSPPYSYLLLNPKSNTQTKIPGFSSESLSSIPLDLKYKKQIPGFSSESLSSVLLDAFLLIAEEKGHITYQDFRRALLNEKSLRQIEIQLLWWRYSRGRGKIGFVEFAQQLRPFGSGV
jgi:hypothetical protein